MYTSEMSISSEAFSKEGSAITWIADELIQDFCQSRVDVLGPELQPLERRKNNLRSAAELAATAL